LRWNLESASREFSFSIPTLRSALAKNSAVAGEDGCFSTQQVVESIFGALHLEKIRTQREVTEKLHIENAVSKGELLNKRELAKGLAAIADALIHRIRASELSRRAQDDLLADIAGIPLSLQEVADRQTRLPRRNGQKHDDEGES
jgi:hypothetical protein